MLWYPHRPTSVNAHAVRAVNECRSREAELWFMRLRHTAVMRLGEASVNVPQIASITDHTLAICHAIPERCNVRTEKIAISAFQQRLEAETLPTGE